MLAVQAACGNSRVRAVPEVPDGPITEDALDVVATQCMRQTKHSDIRVVTTAAYTLGAILAFCPSCCEGRTWDKVYWHLQRLERHPVRSVKKLVGNTLAKLDRLGTPDA
jgi:hypothetical protein